MHNGDHCTDYYANDRPALLHAIGEHAGKVLDVGCGEGVLGSQLLARGIADSVTGVEYHMPAATVASACLTRVFCGDIEDLLNPPSELSKQAFDCILCGDVLEHVRDPWRTIAGLSRLLLPRGRMIVSVPNVRHWSVVFPLLLQGKWQYRQQGILDRTHLRFFTRSTAMELTSIDHLTLTSCQPLCYRRADRLLSACSLGLLDGFVATQWLMVAHHVD